MQARTEQPPSGAQSARLFSIPAGVPFLDALCACIRAGAFSGGGPPVPQTDLPRLTVYLPNRAARETLRLCFLRQAEGGVTFLPRIRVLGEADAETAPLANVPTEMERRLILTRLVLAASETLQIEDEVLYARFTPAEAFATAGTLAQLFDEIETEGRDITELFRFGAAPSAEQEQLSRRILVAVAKGWERVARDRGWTSPARYRNKLLEQEAADLAAEAPGPVIVAGSTASIPATFAFMRAVLALPQGAIVLPGLDRLLDEDAWKVVADHPEHPQYGMAHLLARFGVSRAGVRDLALPPQSGGAGFLAEALRPAATLASWPAYIANAQHGGTPPVRFPLIEAEHIQDEAGIIAHLLREALETPGRTAALVTPDTDLQNRVAGLLARWGVLRAESRDRTADFLLGLAKPVAEDDCTGLVFLLKHIADDDRIFETLTLIEAAALRQSWLPGRIADLPHAVARTRAAVSRGELRHPLYARTADHAWQAAEVFATRIAEAARLLKGVSDTRAPLSRWLDGHAAFVDALARDIPSPGYARATEALGRIGKAAASAGARLMMDAGDYAAFLAAATVTRDPPATPPLHPRLFVWTPLDARLQAADLVILSGLNEGCWPETARANPWLSLGERRLLGLPPPERRLGQAAHDFTMLASLGGAVLTRAKRSNGAPARSARWLVRMTALGAALGPHCDMSAGGRDWVDWLPLRAKPLRVTPCARPEPRPPVNARPRRLSVTAIETWLANPYAVYAQHILRLIELRPPGLDAEARERGMIVHRALHEFTRAHPARLPADVQAGLMDAFDLAAAELAESPRLVAFWRPRFARFAGWFAETEAARREGVARVLSESGAKLDIDAPAGPFTITARADRIDVRHDGRLLIYDYKTSASAIRTAIARKAPQLALEGLLAAYGAFPGTPAIAPSGLFFILAAGGETPGEVEDAAPDTGRLIEATEVGVRSLIFRFDSAETPYRATRRALFADRARFDVYAHLARTAEWSQAGNAGTQS